MRCWRSADRSRGISWLSRLQQGLELSRITALDEEAVGIVAIGQRDAASGDASLPETPCEALRGLLAAAVGVGIKGQIDGSRTVAQLPKLARIEMGSQRAGDVVKAGLPQHGVVEQALDQNHRGKLADWLPCVQATLGARQKSMGEGGSDTAAIEVDDASALAAREDDAPVEGIAAL